ncbi:MAG: DUF4198 domain-containing protein [Cyclobacteriaceae bacterium]|nr:DUF4198 domain-containing protein [Cyclobacteriaceae bacterium]
MKIGEKLSLAVVLIALGILCSSHEFWMQPKKYRFAVGENMPLKLMVGENFEGENWDLNRHKVEKLDLHQLTKVKDVRAQLKPQEKEKLQLKLTEPGTHLVTLESNNAFIELDAAKFNSYLEEDGLENVIALRKENNTTNLPSKEFYKRFAKLLVQVGDKTDDTYKKKIGFRNEIILLKNPYSLKVGDYLTCTVLFDGKPSPHQLVKVWTKIGTTTFLQNLYTENDGTLTFPINAKGEWMVSTVKMIPSETAGADWQSLWASYVFGID